MSALLKWALIGCPAFALLALAGCTLTRAGYKSPKHAVLERLAVRESRDRVEIREYPVLVLAQTPTRKEVEGRDGSFMRLFRFITKGNASAQAIPMTTPVLYRGEGPSEAMAFVLPAAMKQEQAPTPLDSAVTIETRSAGTYATLRMSGRRALARQKALADLRAAVEGSGWRLEGEPEFAFYDPPWTPWFIEKNEVLWRVVRRSGGR